MITEEQSVYARVLGDLRTIGLLGLILTFIIYATGAIPSRIPLKDIPQYWGMSVNDYLARTGLQTGWSWWAKVGYSDLMNFLPIAFLSSITILCYMVVIPIFWRKKEKVYLGITVVQILVLILAASGVLQGR